VGGWYASASLVVSLGGRSRRWAWPLLRTLATSPAVASSESTLTDRLGLRHGRHLMLAETPRDWIEGCLSLLRNPAAAAELRRRAQWFVCAHHGFDEAIDGGGFAAAEPAAGRRSAAA
jgi:hypothetical protein